MVDVLCCSMWMGLIVKLGLVVMLLMVGNVVLVCYLCEVWCVCVVCVLCVVCVCFCVVRFWMVCIRVLSVVLVLGFFVESVSLVFVVSFNCSNVIRFFVLVVLLLWCICMCVVKWWVVFIYCVVGWVCRLFGYFSVKVCCLVRLVLGVLVVGVGVLFESVVISFLVFCVVKSCCRCVLLFSSCVSWCSKVMCLFDCVVMVNIRCVVCFGCYFSLLGNCSIVMFVWWIR